MGRDTLPEITSRLREAAGSGDLSRVSIMVETGEDEAIMIGTRSSYLRLVAELLDAVHRCSNGEGRELQLKVGSITCSSIAGIFDSTAHVVVRTLCLAENEMERARAIELFRSLET